MPNHQKWQPDSGARTGSSLCQRMSSSLKPAQVLTKKDRLKVQAFLITVEGAGLHAACWQPCPGAPYKRANKGSSSLRCCLPQRLPRQCRLS